MDEQDFSIYKGDHKKVSFTVDGVETLTGAQSIIFIASKTVYSEPLIVKNKTDMTISDNVVSVELLPEDTTQDGFREYNYYELEITDSSGRISTVAQGKFQIKETMDNTKLI